MGSVNLTMETYGTDREAEKNLETVLEMEVEVGSDEGEG